VRAWIQSQVTPACLLRSKPPPWPSVNTKANEATGRTRGYVVSSTVPGFCSAAALSNHFSESYSCLISSSNSGLPTAGPRDAQRGFAVMEARCPVVVAQ
jgi:hypothetical protein